MSHTHHDQKGILQNFLIFFVCLHCVKGFQIYHEKLSNHSIYFQQTVFLQRYFLFALQCQLHFLPFVSLLDVQQDFSLIIKERCVCFDFRPHVMVGLS